MKNVTGWLEDYFAVRHRGSTLGHEVLAGITTFVTMAYIIAVNPAILKSAGIPPGPAMVATILVAMVGSILMGLHANQPIAVAPYMGENAFIAFTVVKGLGYRWETAVGAVCISGILFALLTVTHLRRWLLEAIAPGLRYSFAVGVGLFLTFIGLNEAGIVTLGVAGAPLKVGAITSLSVQIAILGFVVISVLAIWRVPGGILFGILISTGLAYLFGLATPPEHWVGLPPSIGPVLFKADLMGVFSWSFFGVLLTIFVMAFVDTLGTLIGVGAQAGLLDSEGHLPRIERAMLVDAIATTLAGLVGSTTSGAYLESATGVLAGGRTGLAAIVTGGLFALALFFAPFVTAIPAVAYSPALIAVGLLMVSPVTKINFQDPTEAIPCLAVIVLMSFTYNIGIGITGGFVLYPVFKLAAGRVSEIKPGLWVLFALSVLFFVFYPYS